ncbi:MAG: hypothetical protein OIF35_09835, partial [Cellvibrionaceae bacterium]|nr:hypothetical protein [Cellvibrionaceae bacterium]
IPCVSSIALLGQVIVECDEVDTMIEKVCGQDVVKAPWGTAVVDMLSQDEYEFRGGRGAVGSARNYLFQRGSISGIFFFNVKVVCFEMVKARYKGGDVHCNAAQRDQHSFKTRVSESQIGDNCSGIRARAEAFDQ